MVAMSGGVDSSVVAWLLKQQGVQVEALHMTNWEAEDEYCSAAEDLQDARKVCDALAITLHHVNFAAEYRERVFAYFLSEYDAGRTPNPDVLCNREIKFGVFADHAKRLGASAIATGHYARTIDGTHGTQLHKGVDASKDQSYFLHAVSSQQLANAYFPLGGLEKSEVREIATQAGLATHRKKDSTGICFIGERPFREFLSKYVHSESGPMVTPEGEIVGEHVGLAHYTAGQRQGLGIGGRQNASDEPWFVAGKRLATNELVVVQGKSHPALYQQGVFCQQFSWINQQPEGLQTNAQKLTAKVRYRQSDQAVSALAGLDGSISLAFDETQWAIACGQYAVLYKDSQCLGGGAIDAITSVAETPDAVACK